MRRKHDIRNITHAAEFQPIYANIQGRFESDGTISRDFIILVNAVAADPNGSNQHAVFVKRLASRKDHRTIGSARKRSAGRHYRRITGQNVEQVNCWIQRSSQDSVQCLSKQHELQTGIEGTKRIDRFRKRTFNRSVNPVREEGTIHSSLCAAADSICAIELETVCRCSIDKFAEIEAVGGAV